ncbi:MAG: lysylphosphatidylglycerol synthase transmembrane domain-containing protein [Acidimicrobiales bacterium]
MAAVSSSPLKAPMAHHHDAPAPAPDGGAARADGDGSGRVEPVPGPSDTATTPTTTPAADEDEVAVGAVADEDEGELAEYAELSVHELTELAEAGQEPTARPRRRWVLPLRILVSLAMLGVLVWKVPDFSLDELVPAWTPGTFAWLGGAALLTVVGVALSAVRWSQVLRALERPAPLRRLVSLCFAGQFVSNVLPTTIGGDVLRVSRLARDNDDAATSFASVALERLTGWLVLPLIAYLGFALNPGLARTDPGTGVALVAVTVTLVGLVLILVAAYHPRLGGRMRDRAGWRRFLGAVHVGVDRLRHRPADAGRVVGAGFAYQLVLCLAAWMAAQALGIDQVGVTVMLAFFPAVLMAQVLPLGIAGLGLREISFTVFLQPLGVPPERAIALGLLLYLLNLGVSLLGAPAFALQRRTAADHAADRAPSDPGGATTAAAPTAPSAPAAPRP